MLFKDWKVSNFFIFLRKNSHMGNWISEIINYIKKPITNKTCFHPIRKWNSNFWYKWNVDNLGFTKKIDKAWKKTTWWNNKPFFNFSKWKMNSFRRERCFNLDFWSSFFQDNTYFQSAWRWDLASETKPLEISIGQLFIRWDN